MSEQSADSAQRPFVGSIALIGALYETYEQHIGVAENDGPDGPYVWCSCGWRSDDGGATSYGIHLVNAQHAAAASALRPVVERARREGFEDGVRRMDALRREQAGPNTPPGARNA